MTVTTSDEGLRKLWEPATATVEERFGVLAEAHARGLATAVMFGPLLPFLSDDEKSIDGLFARAADLEVETIWVDALNPRPRVWPAVAALLRREFPELEGRYRAMLFDEQVRTQYLTGLGERVRRGAARQHLTDRLQGCP